MKRPKTLEKKKQKKCGQSVATHGGGGGGGRRSERVVQKSCISAVDESVAGGMRRLTHFCRRCCFRYSEKNLLHRDDREEEEEEDEEEEKMSVRVGDGDSSVPIFHSRDGLLDDPPPRAKDRAPALLGGKRGPAISTYLHYLSFLAIPTLGKYSTNRLLMSRPCLCKAPMECTKYHNQ